jgi:hypothetical protein
MWTLIVIADSRQQQQPPAPAPAVAQIIQNNTKSSLLYYVLYVLIVLCILLCIMYFRSLVCRRLASGLYGHSLLRVAPVPGLPQRLGCDTSCCCCNLRLLLRTYNI